MKTHKRILHAARWVALALSAHTFALAALAQSPLPDSFNPGANYFVYSLAVQADGKILVGGAFGTLGGQSRNYIGRLNADGTLDTRFNSGANWTVFSLAGEAEGEGLVGGWFSTPGGPARKCNGPLNVYGA